MGYEHRIYIVRKTSQYEYSLDKYWAQVICRFDLGKNFELETMKDYYKPTNCFIYADDGNTEILEDECGDPLREIALDDFIDDLKDMVDRGTTSGVQILLATLQAFKEHDKVYRDIVCLHYGC